LSYRTQNPFRLKDLTFCENEYFIGSSLSRGHALKKFSDTSIVMVTMGNLLFVYGE